MSNNSVKKFVINEKNIDRLYKKVDAYIDSEPETPFPTAQEVELEVVPLYENNLCDKETIVLFFLWLDSIREELRYDVQDAVERFMKKYVDFQI